MALALKVGISAWMSSGGCATEVIMRGSRPPTGSTANGPYGPGRGPPRPGPWALADGVSTARSRSSSAAAAAAICRPAAECILPRGAAFGTRMVSRAVCCQAEGSEGRGRREGDVQLVWVPVPGHFARVTVRKS